MSNLICDTGRTRLDYADTRAACRVGKNGFGRGVVEQTALGSLVDGQIIDPVAPVGIPRDKCKAVNRKKVCDDIC